MSSSDSLARLRETPELLRVLGDSIGQALAGLAALPFQRDPSDAPPALDKLYSAGLIRYEGVGFSIEVLLAMPAGVSAKSESAFLDENASSNPDLPGEVLNVAFGFIDPQWRGYGLHTTSSFPIVVHGRALRDLIEGLPLQSITRSFVFEDKRVLLQIFPGGSMEQKWRYTNTATVKR